jgi:carbon starvation protein
MRLSRYLLEELWIVLFQGKEKVPTLLLERWVNTLIPAFFVAILAFSRGYEPIWPLFGATNQLLAGLTLIVATAWLLKKGKTSFFAWIPAGFMTITTLSALGIQLVKRWEKGDYLLVSLATALILLAVGMIFAVLKTRQSGGEKRLWGVK